MAQNMQKINKKMHSIFESYVKKGDPGLAVLVVKNNEVIYRAGFGVADLQTKEPITTSTLFNIGSISKTFVTYGILRLAQENKLSLEDDLLTYFPDFENKELARKVKIIHLLTHSSGIPDNRPVKQEHEFYLTARDEENFEPLKKTTHLEFEPGTRYRYSNPAFNGLALIIEKLAGKKWQDYLRDIIFKPAGMDSSTITDGPHPETGVSHGYVKNDRGLFEELDYGEEPTFAASGNGGVWSSVDELWQYEKAVQQAIFLNKDWMEISRQVYPFPSWKDTQPSRLGLSWFITKENGVNITGHTGSQGGFISDYCWLPDQKIFYVLLCNFPYPIAEIRQKLFSLLKENEWLEK